MTVAQGRESDISCINHPLSLLIGFLGGGGREMDIYLKFNDGTGIGSDAPVLPGRHAFPCHNCKMYLGEVRFQLPEEIIDALVFVSCRGRLYK